MIVKVMPLCWMLSASGGETEKCLSLMKKEIFNYFPGLQNVSEKNVNIK